MEREVRDLKAKIARYELGVKDGKAPRDFNKGRGKNKVTYDGLPAAIDAFKRTLAEKQKKLTEMIAKVNA